MFNRLEPFHRRCSRKRSRRFIITSALESVAAPCGVSLTASEAPMEFSAGISRGVRS